MRNLILLTLALLALAAVADSTYTFRVVMTEDVWDGKDFTPTGWVFDDDGTPWILGRSATFDGSIFWELMSDTLGNLDTLFLGGLDTQFFGEKYFRTYFIREDTLDTLNLGSDTLIITEIVADTVVYHSIFGGATWKYTKDYIWPITVGDNGWAFAELDTTDPIVDLLYPGWVYCVTRNGEPTHEVELVGTIFNQRGHKIIRISIKEEYFAIPTSSPSQISVFDTSGEFKFSKYTRELGFSWELLPNGSIIYTSGGPDSLLLSISTDSTDFNYWLEDANEYSVDWASDSNNLFLTYRAIQESTSFYILDYFLFNDTLELLWQDTLEDDAVGLQGLLPDGTPWHDVDLSDSSFWFIKVLAKNSGGLITNYPSFPARESDNCLRYTESNGSLIALFWPRKLENTEEAAILLRIEKVGE